jgi:hypothetical protein
MRLNSVVPFINYQAAEKTPQLLEWIIYRIEALGHTPQLIDSRTVFSLIKEDIRIIRVPWILCASASDDAHNDLHLYNTLKEKFPTALKIEASVKDMPRILSEREAELSLWLMKLTNEKVKNVFRFIY